MDYSIVTVIAALYWIITWSLVGRWIGIRLSKRPGAGLALGLLLGPLGCAIALSLSPMAPPPPDPIRTIATAARRRAP